MDNDNNKRRNSRRTLWVSVVGILIVVGVIIALPYINGSQTEEATEINDTAPRTGGRGTLTVDAEIVRTAAMRDATTALGDVIPAEEVELMFETSGKITGIYFREGESVTKGTLLAKINDAPLQAQLKKLEAQVKLAQDRVYRQQTLLERDAVSQEAYETVETEYNKLMADIELVKANIAQTEIRAPFDGIIGLRYVSEGAFVSPTTQIARLVMTSLLKIDFSINETFAGEMKAGQKVNFSVQDGEGRTHTYSAKVYAVESSIDKDTRSLRVRAEFSNRGRVLRPGMYVTVEIMRQSIPNAISVPSEAIIPEMGQQTVYLYKNGTAQRTDVTLGLRGESRVQILNGISEGDTVLVAGVMQLRHGMAVALENIF